jgi:tRNA threonylcarbamoyladenosine biosynthesis protein TsaE
MEVPMPEPAELVLSLRNEERTRVLGRLLGERATPGLVILLFGELGAGKTTLAQGLTEGLGCATRASSPTFNLLHLHSGRLPLVHADLYRLDDADSVEDLGLAEMVEAGAVAAVEWPELAGDALPEERVEVTLLESGEGREAHLRAVGREAGELLAGLADAYSVA